MMMSSSDAGASQAAAWFPDELQFVADVAARQSVSDAADALDAAARREALEREAAISAAYARGFEEGREAGAEAEAARFRTGSQAVAQALAQIAARERVFTENLKDNLCALAVGIARHIVGREIEGDATVTEQLVRNALESFPIDQPVRVRVNPADLAALSTNAGTHPSLSHRDSVWMADPLIAPGGCIVEGRERIIDGRIDTALERVYRKLTQSNA
jgi:flagellar biosynthesis/type III secretory pathway protein FliH